MPTLLIHADHVKAGYHPHPHILQEILKYLFKLHQSLILRIKWFCHQLSLVLGAYLAPWWYLFVYYSEWLYYLTNTFFCSFLINHIYITYRCIFCITLISSTFLVWCHNSYITHIILILKKIKYISFNPVLRNTFQKQSFRWIRMISLLLLLDNFIGYFILILIKRSFVSKV